MASVPVAPTGSAYKQPSLIKRVLAHQEIAVMAACALFFIIFTAANPAMAERENLLRMALQGSFLALATFPLSFLMIAGEIDLSSGSAGALSAAVAGVLIATEGWAEPAAYAVALLAALVVGALNAFIVLKIKMPSFFATIGTSFLVSGLAIWILKGTWLYLGEMIPMLQKIVAPSPFFALPWIFVIVVALYVVGDLLMRTSKIGPILTAVGANRRAAEITGINVKLTKAILFLFVSVCCGAAGIMVMAYASTTDGSIGSGWMLWLIATVIIGGGSLRGGVGSVIGAFFGVVLVQIIRMGLLFANVQTNAQGIVIGAVLIGAAALDVVRRKSIQY
jgi:ribose/xylose/arabinose/galactoside ABC-type transport system permease subunit